MSPARLAGLPVEVLLDICHFLDVDGVSSLSQTDRFFRSLIQSNRSIILFPILQREFSPFDELLQIYTASAEDTAVPVRTHQPRRVIFRRGPGDRGIVLAKGGFRGADSSPNFTKVGRSGKSSLPPSRLSPVQTVVLGERDLGPLLKQCWVIRKWEELFPHLRWLKQPAYCRSLEQHEGERLRRALYRWWLYAYYFHGDLERPHHGQPMAFVDDIRVTQMRMYPTSELIELLDLLTTVFHMVQHYICPMLERDLVEDYDSSPAMDAEVLWNDQSRLGRIVRTYTKLDPKELAHYFDQIYNYSKRRLISDVRLRHPNFLGDQESLQAAIRSALSERPWLGRFTSVPTDTAGGIVDFGDVRDEERAKYQSDGSVDGSLPKPATYLRVRSEYAPRGDDGDGCEKWSYPRWQPRDRLALSLAV